MKTDAPLPQHRGVIRYPTLATQPTCASGALAMTSQGLVEAGYSDMWLVTCLENSDHI